MGKLQSKVAIVTGAARGIGRATAMRFANEGAQVLLADVNDDGGRETERLITETGGHAQFVHCDVSCREEVERLVMEAVSIGRGIHILFNGAGILVPGLVEDLPEEVWDRIIAVNLKSVYLTSKITIPEMLKSGGGSIINVGSVNSLVAEPYLPAYCASKGGVLMLTKQIAIDYAQKNIRCNCICPGWVDTPINDPHAEMMGGREKVLATIAEWQPVGRQGTPEEIANVAAFVASDEASFMTGSAVVVDGGMTAK